MDLLIVPIDLVELSDFQELNKTYEIKKFVVIDSEKNTYYKRAN